MSKYKKLSHVIYQCKYHIVFVPKYRYKVLEGIIKTQLEEDIRMYSEWKSVEIEEMNIQKDHVHLVVSIPPRVSLSTTSPIAAFTRWEPARKTDPSLSTIKASSLMMGR